MEVFEWMEERTAGREFGAELNESLTLEHAGEEDLCYYHSTLAFGA